MSDEVVYDVAVMGGGLSGLIAARKLLEAKPSLRVVVLEASDRIGGRIWTDDEGTELGAAFFGPSQNRMVALIYELGLHLYSIDTDGPQVLMHGDGTRRVFDGFVPARPWWVRLDVNSAMCRIDADVAQVSASEPYLAPRARELDTMSLPTYLRSICWTEDAYHYLMMQLSTVQTTEPMHLSALEALWFLRNVGSLTAMLVGESWKVKGGNSQIVHGVANALPHGTVRLSSPVRKIDTTHAEYVELRGLDFRVRAKRVVSAIPPFQLGRVEFAPPLPSTRVQELMHYPMGNVIKTFTYYSKRHWKPLNGRVLSNAKGTVANDIFDDSNPTSEEGVILGFIGADASGIYGDLKPEERCKLLAEQYAVALDCPAMRQPIRYKEKTFGNEPWVGGCYFGVPRAGVLTAYRRQWRQTYADGRLFFAGTEAADEWMAYMEGAYEAGERAARGILTSFSIPLPPLRDYAAEAKAACVAQGEVEYSASCAPFGDPKLPTLKGVVIVASVATITAVCAAGAALWLRRHH